MLLDTRKTIQEYRQRLDVSTFGISMRRFNGSRQVSINKKLMNIVCMPNTISGGTVHPSKRNREKRTIYRNFEKMNITEQVK